MGKKCDCGSEAHTMITCPLCNKNFHLCYLCQWGRFINEYDKATAWICLSCNRDERLKEILDD